MTDAHDAEAIASIVEARAQAVRAGQVDALMADVADDIVSFDVVDPLCRMGKLAARSRTVAWLESYDGPIGLEVRDLHITADGDVAFSHALNRVTGTLKDKATEVDMWFRTTLGFRRIGARWLVVHEHGSVPFDAESGQASLGLKPG